MRVQGGGLWASSLPGDTGPAAPHPARGGRGGAASDARAAPERLGFLTGRELPGCTSACSSRIFTSTPGLWVRGHAPVPQPHQRLGGGGGRGQDPRGRLPLVCGITRGPGDRSAGAREHALVTGPTAAGRPGARGRSTARAGRVRVREPRPLSPPGTPSRQWGGLYAHPPGVWSGAIFPTSALPPATKS